MAGRPKLMALRKTIAAMGGDEWLLDELVEHTLKYVCDILCVNRNLLRAYLKNDPDRWKRYQAARKERAGVLVDEAGEIADASTSTTTGVAQLRMKHRQWEAGKLDRETYGDSPQIAIGIAAGELHLDALRARAPKVGEEIVIDAPGPDLTALLGGVGEG